MALSSLLSKQSVAIFSAVTVVGLTGATGATPAQAAVINGNFNSGLTGWQTLGGADASSGAAVLTPSVANTTDVENFLGLSTGALAGIATSPTNGAAIKQSFFATAGTVVSFDWLFQANDYLPYNDFAFYSLVAATGATLLSNVAAVGNYGSSGLQSLSYTITTAGTYTLGFGVFNSFDQGLPSTLTIDNVATVPTPALLPGLIGIGMAAFRKRKAEAVEKTSEA